MAPSSSALLLREWRSQTLQVIFFLCNVAAWYATNAFHGISMQRLSADRIAAQQPNDTTSLSLAWQEWESIMVLTSFVTAGQLLAGGVVGYLFLTVLYLWHPFDNHHQLEKEEQEGCRFTFLPKLSSRESMPLFLGVLHGIGSLTTNIGYMRGSASLVQIIKLLEPVYTWLWMLILLPRGESSRLLATGIFCSMIVIVVSAMSLVPGHKTTTTSSLSSSHATSSILFTVASGWTLSARNVLQRRLQQQQQKSALPLPQSKYLPHTNDESTSEHPSSSLFVYKLKKSLAQFTVLSLQSGLSLLVATFVIHAACLLYLQMIARVPEIALASSRNAALLAPLRASPTSVWMWHPAYNAFSMITLGLCQTALTHALLNAGKRIISIVVAMVWFHEPLRPNMAQRLFVGIVGVVWYTLESKASAKSAASTSTTQNTTTTTTAAAQTKTGRKGALTKWVTVLVLVSVLYLDPPDVTIE